MKMPDRVTAATADVLEVLLKEEAPVWGLKIVKSTQRPTGSVYPILSRLEQAGWVTSLWDEDTDRTGPRRRLYEMVDDAIAPARSALAAFREREQERKRKPTDGATAIGART